ncbi:MAG: hypothetical protein KJ072_16790 [Verrucomicrobia bacterium]|nr:hypothetical protein [Verrucomicrobiota bacterium]
MITARKTHLTALVLVSALACATGLLGQDAATEDQAAKAAALAKATLNPIASLISVPLQNNFDWGAGPVLQLPTATDDLLGEEKWGAGPTAVVLKQEGHWTYGALVNHIWSFAGESARSDVNRTFLQPFVSYTTKTFTSFGLNTESSYDWEREQWTVPVNAFVQQLLKVGKPPVALQLGGRYYADGPSGAPEWGLRFQLSFLFPK